MTENDSNRSLYAAVFRFATVGQVLVILTDFLKQLLYVYCISGTGLHKYGCNGLCKIFCLFIWNFPRIKTPMNISKHSARSQKSSSVCLAWGPCSTEDRTETSIRGDCAKRARDCLQMSNNYTDAKTDSWDNYERKGIKHDSKCLNGKWLN